MKISIYRYWSRESITRGIWAYVFAFILLEPAAFQHFNIIDDIFDILHIMLFAIVVVFRISSLLMHKKKIPIDLWVCIYYAYLLTMTLINDGMVKSVFLQAIQFIGFAMYLELVMEFTPDELYRSIYNILLFYLILNFLTILIYDNGLYATSYYDNNYLFGYDNQNINFILPILCLCLLKNLYYKKCLLQILLIYTISMASALIIWSGASMLLTGAMALFAGICLRKKGTILDKVLSGVWFNFRNLLIVNGVAAIGLIFFKIQYYFEYFITVILKKSMTLTSRTIIWERNIKLIKKRFWFGYGKEEYAKRAAVVGFRDSSPAGLHAHNRFMETWYRGGVFLEIIYIHMLLKTAKSLWELRNTKAAKIISFTLFIYMCGMLTEFYDYCIFFFGLMVIAENCDGIVGKDNA